MAAVASVQAVSSPAPASTQNAASATGDTGFMATLDGIIQALSAVEATAQGTTKQDNTAQANPTALSTEIPEESESQTTAELDTSQAVDAVAGKNLQDLTTQPSISATDGKPSVQAIPAQPILVPTVLAKASANTAVSTTQAPVTADSDVSDSDMLAVTLAQPVKFPIAQVAEAKAPSVPAPDMSEAQPDDQLPAENGTPVLSTNVAPADDSTPLSGKAVKTSNNQSSNQANDPSTFQAATAPLDTVSTMMLAAAASQQQAAPFQPQPSVQDANSSSIQAVGMQPGAQLQAQPQLQAAGATTGKPAAALSSPMLTIPERSAAADKPLAGNAPSIPSSAPVSQPPSSANSPAPAAQPQTAPVATASDESANPAPILVAASSVPAESVTEAKPKTIEAAPATSSTPQTSQSGDVFLSIQPQATGPATTASSIAPATGITATSPTEQVSLVVQKGLADGSTSMTIALDPADLGKVEVKLDISKDGSVQANVIADNAETLNMLKNDNAGLHQALHNAGFTTDASSLNFSLRGDNQNQTQGQGFAQAQQQQQSARNSVSYSIQASVIDENSTATQVTGTQYASSTGNSHVNLFV